MSDEPPKREPVIGYLIAAAILIPLGIWLKANYAEQLGRWTLSLFGH